MKRLPAALVTVVLALSATACGGDDGSGEEKPAAEASTTEATESSTPPETGATGTEDSSDAPDDATTALTDEGTPDPSRVEEIAGILGCDLGAGKQAVDGETEYACGEFLIVDWGTADVTEEEMWAHVDSWTDEQRPQYVPADQFILVYGTGAALEPHSDELLDG